MMHKAKENGLLFSPAAEAQYLAPPPANAAGQAHDQWKLIPWGLPEHRNVPPIAAMSNSVNMRLAAATLDPAYRPENVGLNAVKNQLTGYPIAPVLPYEKPAPIDLAK
jgi:hypothetical protein